MSVLKTPAPAVSISPSSAIIEELKREIKHELVKLTNLVQKKCSICTSVEKNFVFSYEAQNNIFVYVCSSCIIKLALNELVNNQSKDQRTKYLLEKDLLQIIDYVSILLQDLHK